MSPEIQQLNDRIVKLESFVLSFMAKSSVDPLTTKTIVDIIGSNLTLNDLADVIIVTPSDTEVVKYQSSSGKWKNLPDLDT